MILIETIIGNVKRPVVAGKDPRISTRCAVLNNGSSKSRCRKQSEQGFDIGIALIVACG